MNRLNVVIMLIVGLLCAQSAQDMLNRAKELWSSGDCAGAMAMMEKVRARLNDFPEKLRAQVEATYIAWNDTITENQNIYSRLLNAIPPLRTQKGELLPLNELQNARDRIAELNMQADKITCHDIRMKLKNRLRACQDSTNHQIDTHIDNIVVENKALSKSVDSLRVLAKKYRQLLPVLDSLRAIIARNSENLAFLQAQLDSMVKVATEAVRVTKRIGEMPTSISAPVQIVSDAALEIVESKIIVLGETKIRKGKYKDEQKDTLIMELDNIIAWLDTSMAGKLVPEKAAALRELANGYRDMLVVQPQKRDYTGVIIIGGLLVIVVISAIFVLRKKK